MRNISISAPTFLGNEEKYILDAVQFRRLSMGSYIHQFEQHVARMAGKRYAVAVSSGTAALHVSLLALGVKEGDSVIVPACSYIAVANAVRYCGATPVFVDVYSDSWTMDSDAAVDAARKNGAIGFIVVNLYGVPCKYPVSNGLWVLEDACESHGIHVGGDVGVFSFYGNKIVTCGEGGAVVTDDKEIGEKVRLLRGQGTTGAVRYVHEMVGYNYRMTDLQAAIGCGQIECLAVHLQNRATLRRLYDSLLPVPQQAHRYPSVDWVVPVLVKNRREVVRQLSSVGIETRPVFPPLHQQPPYRTEQSLPTSELLGEQGLLLPLHLGMTEDDVRYVVHCLKEAIKVAA